MNIINTRTLPKGQIEAIFDYEDGKQIIHRFDNTVLNAGRSALAKSLANDYGNIYQFYVDNMLFGDGGTSGTGVPYSVNAERTGLFGTTIERKGIISNVDANIPTQAVFTSVLKFDEANGNAINEIALEMNNDELYSLATFAGFNKTSSMQVTFNWRLSFI